MTQPMLDQDFIDKAVGLADYFDWLCNTRRYYHEESPIESDTARKYAREILKTRDRQ